MKKIDFENFLLKIFEMNKQIYESRQMLATSNQNFQVNFVEITQINGALAVNEKYVKHVAHM